MPDILDNSSGDSGPYLFSNFLGSPDDYLAVMNFCPNFGCR